MKAHQIMNKQVFKVKEDDSVRSVIEKFISYQISGLPIVNDRNEMVAYVSDGDIMRFIGKHPDYYIDNMYYSLTIKGDDEEFEARKQRLLDLNVMEIAKKKVITVSSEEEIESIAAILGRKQIKKFRLNETGY